MTPRLLEKYRNEIIPKMMETFSFKNRLAVPRLEKIVVNMGVGEALQDIKILEKAMEELSSITGQKPILRRAKKAIANFKINNFHKHKFHKLSTLQIRQKLLHIAHTHTYQMREHNLKHTDARTSHMLHITHTTYLSCAHTHLARYTCCT